MSTLNKLDEISHRVTIGTDLLAEMVFELGNSKEVDEKLQARAWFVCQTLKRDAADLCTVTETIAVDGPRTETAA